MGIILYGNLRVEIRDQSGARLDRLGLRDTLPRFPRPFPLPEGGVLHPLARNEQVNDAYAAVRCQRPVEFTATCGYGKSTLLRHLAANSVYEGLSGPSVYLPVGGDKLEDVVQRIVTELYVSALPFKATPEECARLLGEARALVVLDDVTLDPGEVTRLVRILPGCGLVLGCARPVLGRNGTTRMLAGLPNSAAVELITREIGRPLTASETSAVERLAAAVEGQPLHLRQAAALNREDGLSFEYLARTAERDPDELDRLSVRKLADQERRALAVLALAAGALVPAGLVATMGDIATIGQALEHLHRRGLAEQQADRFGLPVCKKISYREMTLKDLHLAAALRELAMWLADRDPTSADSLSGAGAALAVIEWAAELGDWPAVTRLVRVVEPALTLAGRWEASSHLLGQGLEAAKAAGDRVTEALFTHQQGTLAFCRDDLESAVRLLEHALRLREQTGDQQGAEVTRHNLRLLRPQPVLPRPDPGLPTLWRTLLAVGGAVVGLVVLALTVKAVIIHPSPAPTATATPTTSASRTQATPTPSRMQPTGGGNSSPSGGGAGGESETNGGSTPPLNPPVMKSVNFGDIDITSGTAPGSIAILVSNPNAQPLFINSAEITGVPAFTKTLDSCSATMLSPRQSCSVTAQFAPSALGPSTGTLTISSKGAEQAIAQLTGIGFASLEVTVKGTGSGSVQDSSLGLSCDGDCSERITSPAQASITLTEIPAKGPGGGALTSLFGGWGGACLDAERASSCGPLQITADTQVTAEFDTVVG